ncbi:MAG: hypothetical protein II966_07500 [Lachnospiraceae bacterium]|nr:hypothetical protein [Lachnospiraceae bacterium]
MKMSYDDFNELVRRKLEDICGKEFSVSVYEALKNNSVVYKGITIREECNNVAPTIYMEEFYTDYCDGKDIEEIVNDILRVYSSTRKGPEFETEKFSDFEWVRERIFFKLVNARQNALMLQNVPSGGFLDLAMVYAVYMGTYRDSFSSVTIRNEHLDMWGVNEEEVKELAVKNTPVLLPSNICSMKEMLDGMGVKADGLTDEIPMYILSNRDRVNGAASMAYEGVVGRFARDLGSDLYILPSSIHELIIVPAGEEMDPRRLVQMIREVNDTQVSREEVLSYSLYQYSREREALEIAWPAGRIALAG